VIVEDSSGLHTQKCTHTHPHTHTPTHHTHTLSLSLTLPCQERLGSRLQLLEDASTTLVTALRRTSSLAELQLVAGRVESTLGIAEEKPEESGATHTPSAARPCEQETSPRLQPRSPWVSAVLDPDAVVVQGARQMPGCL
jgi:hypothetical protein